MILANASQPKSLSGFHDCFKPNQKRFVFFIMRRNSSSFTSPSPSRSASSIISCNSSSVIRSPSSLATRLRFLNEIFPVSSSSKSRNALRISSFGPPKLLRDALEVLERDLSGLVVIEEPERLEDLVLRVTVKDLLRHHRHELRKFDGPRPIIVDVLDHLLDLLLLRLEAESAHGDLELLRVDGAGTVSVEQVKGFLDLLLLLLSELLLLAATAAETTTQRHRRSRLFC